MKKEMTITLSTEDQKTLLYTANIMEALSNDGRCWTARDIRALCNKDIEHSASDTHCNIIFEW